MPNSTPHFSPELFKFLRALKRSNNREWFNKNKDRYLEHVRDPMLAFIEDLAPKLKKISRHLVVDPSPTGGSMFRIYRDVRFSKDKRPYKTAATARFPYRGKNVCGPGFYVHLGVDGVFAAAGIWHPESAPLRDIRDHIADNAAAWQRAINGKPFKDGTFVLEGESLKRPPRGIDPEHPLVKDLKRKDFIAVAHLDEATACAPDFLDTYTSLCKAAVPFSRFLAKGVGVEW